MDPARVQEAMKHGLAFVCATCNNWHKGVDVRLTDDDGDTVCLKHKTCGGPLMGRLFGDYEGPIVNMMTFCHCCGKDADKAVGVDGQLQRVGVCSDCLGVLKRMAKQGRNRNIIFVGNEG